MLPVDAAYTSQRCPLCGHTERANRPTRDDFCCRRCRPGTPGLTRPGDVQRGFSDPVVRRRNPRSSIGRAWSRSRRCAGRSSTTSTDHRRCAPHQHGT
ncbi:zinc ribbon domain-containing protein [Saccharopolyspora sp. NPDC002376]